MANDDLLILGGRTHPDLTEQIARALETEVAAVRLESFANGEVGCRLLTSVSGHDVYVVQSHGHDVNTSIMEQLVIIDAAKRGGARRVTAVCPFLGYSRQDRTDGGQPVTARLVIDMLGAAGAGQIITLDMHTDQIQGFFSGPFRHLSARPVLLKYIQEQPWIHNVVVVSPDTGRVKLAERYAAALGAGMAIVHKQRTDGAEARSLIGDVSGKTCLIIDDMIDTAETLVGAAGLLKNHGAQVIYGMATHSILSGDALALIEDSPLQKIATTDSLLSTAATQSQKFEVLSIAEVIAAAMR